MTRCLQPVVHGHAMTKCEAAAQHAFDRPRACFRRVLVLFVLYNKEEVQKGSPEASLISSFSPSTNSPASTLLYFSSQMPTSLDANAYAEMTANLFEAQIHLQDGIRELQRRVDENEGLKSDLEQAGQTIINLQRALYQQGQHAQTRLKELEEEMNRGDRRMALVGPLSESSVTLIETMNLWAETERNRASFFDEDIVASVTCHRCDKIFTDPQT
ncbi:hypothetical protein V5O48_012685 [Marasmius crinis-equi]|uniref:Uncharacterized protein n=1 Tax=Marasmius crinis-equi TaxID=585013 RepID=A0ABR3F237_9AGAR